MKIKDSFRLTTAILAFSAFSLSGLGQTDNPRGIYKLKSIISKGIERQHNLDQYKVCTDSVAIGFRLEDVPLGGGGYFSSQVMQHLIDSWSEEPHNYTGKSHPDETDKSVLVFDSDDKHFTIKWWVKAEVTDTLHFPFFGHVWCTETYEADQYSENGKLFFDAIMKPQPSDKDLPLIGAWKNLGVLPPDKLNEDGIERLREAYPSSEMYNQAFYIFTPSNWFFTTVRQGRLVGAFNKASYIGTDALRDGIAANPLIFTWMSKDCAAMELSANDSIVGYCILDRVTDDVPVFNRIAYSRVPRNFDWFLRDAEAGNAQSQFRIAGAYTAGQGVEKDIQKGFEWLEKSAEGGFMHAQHWLGVAYLTGEIGEKSPEKAFGWLRKAAEQGDPDSQAIVGDFYLNGEFVEKDEQEAIKWFQLSADNGKMQAQRLLGYYYREETMDYQKALFYFMRAAEQGDANSQNEVGVMYKYGLGVEKDDAQAFEWYQKSADQGYALAQRNVGFCYKFGKGVEKDMSKAYDWLLKAAEGGNASAQNEVAWMLYTGEDVPQDLHKAFEWAQKAVEQEDPFGYGTLAEMYYKGKGVAQDKAKAFELYSKGAELEDRESTRMLAIMYKKGEGTKKDKKKAAYWQKKYDEIQQGQSDGN